MGYCNESATDIQTRIACVDSRDWMERMRMEHTKRVGKRRSRTRPGDCGASVRCLSSERRPRRGECCAKLAAQHAQYLYKQLADYRTKPNETAPERSSPVMAGFAAALSGQDMQDVAAYFAVQPVSTAFAQHPEDIELGQKIWRRGIQERRVPACAACHSATGAGIPVQYPRLAGQWQDYTIEQLKAFQSGARHN